MNRFEMYDRLYGQVVERLEAALRDVPDLAVDERPNRHIVPRPIARDAPGRLPLVRGMRRGEYVFVNEGNPRMRALRRPHAIEHWYGTRRDAERGELPPQLRGESLVDRDFLFTAALTWPEFVNAGGAKAQVDRVADQLGGRTRSFEPARRRGVVEVKIEFE